MLYSCFSFSFQVSHVLDAAKDHKEHIVRVYGETLTREYFLILGLQKDVEAMRQWSNMHSHISCVICLVMDFMFVHPADSEFLSKGYCTNWIYEGNCSVHYHALHINSIRCRISFVIVEKTNKQKHCVNFVFQNVQVWVTRSYISVTWLPPLSANPMDHFPVSFFLCIKMYTLLCLKIFD